MVAVAWPMEAPPMPPVRVNRPRRAAPADAVRPTRAEVNLAAIRKNLHAVRKLAGNQRVLGVLKADGYGHGAPAVARTLERAGIDGFAVALLEEAIELRDAGIKAPILVMGGLYGNACDEVLSHDLTPVVYDRGQIEALARAARAAGVRARVHLKIDTGMARLGVREEELPGVLSTLHDLPELEVEGLMTHLACADAPTRESMDEQLARFDVATARVREAGVAFTTRHAANSAALLRGAPALGAVRPGLALFGLSPLDGGPSLAPVMRVRSEIACLRRLAAGESAGYGWTFTARRPTVLATVPVGYADGLSRSLSNRGSMLVRGKRAPIAGTVSMDMVMLDVTDVEGATVRDEVVVLGAQQGPLGRDEIRATELAELAGTIPWEILTSISRRVPRFYREP